MTTAILPLRLTLDQLETLRHDESLSNGRSYDDCRREHG